MRTKSIVIGLLLATTSCQIASRPVDSRQDTPHDISGAKIVLQHSLGGDWKMSGNILQGRNPTGDSAFAFTLLPNPRTSLEGLRAAESIRYLWSSIQLVFAESDDFLFISMSDTLTPQHHKAAELLDMTPVRPPVRFKDFVAKNCECVWDLKSLSLKKTESQSGGPD
jgi:hypothetical protein